MNMRLMAEPSISEWPYVAPQFHAFDLSGNEMKTIPFPVTMSFEAAHEVPIADKPGN